MKDLQNKIQQVLLNQKRNNRFVALFIALSIIVSFIVPYIQMAPGVAITESEMSGIITSDMPNMTDNENTNVSISVNATDFGTTINAGDSSTASIWLQVAYAFNINTGDGDNVVNYNQPYFYFELKDYDVDLLQDFTNLKASDTSDEWIAWRSSHGLDNQYPPATYDVYQNENGKIYVIVKLSDKYIEYVNSKNGEVQGNVKFTADVSRDESQSGDKTIYDGEADLTVSFDDKTPTLDKTGNLTGQYDAETGRPIINWTITVTDFYELANYPLSDTHLDAMIDGTLKAVAVYTDAKGNETQREDIGISADGNTFKFSDTTSNANKIIITYQSVATEEELLDTSHNTNGYASNEVSLNYTGVSSDTGTVDLQADFKADIEKVGTPSYEYDGSKGYMYWTVTVKRNYNMSLDGYVIEDIVKNSAGQEVAIEFVKAENADVSGSAPWTISNHTQGETVKITYRTLVEEDGVDTFTNKATVTPPNSSTKDDSKEIVKNYDDTNLFTVTKNGTFSEDTEKITWEITIDATANSLSKENLNGYVIEDDAFSRADIENLTVTAYNDNSNVVYNGSISEIATKGSDGKYTVNSDVDKIIIKYTVPLTESEEANRNNGAFNAENTVTVTSDDGSDTEPKKGTAPVSSNVIGITANKNWVGYFSDDDRTYPVEIILQKKVGSNGDWTNVESKKITSSTDDQFVSFDDLPKKENGEQVTYRVIENASTGADYTVGYSHEYGVTTDSTLTITNTWNNMAVSVIKDWKGDSGHENERPDVTFRLYQRIDWGGEETATGKYAILDIETNKITYFNSDGTSTGVDAWSDLPRTDDNGKTIFYWVVEDPVAGYTSSGSNATLTSTGTITITNTADYFNLTANKNWNDGGFTDDRTEITFDLYQSTDPTDPEKWEKITSKSQTITSETNDSVIWEWLPTKDSAGNTLYYKVVEAEVPTNYSVSYSNEYITASSGNNQTITVTNTWELMNVHVRKNWVNVSDDDKPDGVTFELWSWVEGIGWNPVEKITPETVTVTAENSWELQNAWTKLPKTTTVDGVTLKIYYAAREVGTSEDYISTYDTVGINDTNWSVVTNKPAKITVTANKVWSYSTAELPSGLSFHLEQSTDMGASWSSVANSIRTMDATNNWEDILTWSDLPVQTEDGTEILYRVVEDTELDDFTTSYSPAYVSANNGKITVTNQQKANYEKFAVKPDKYEHNGQTIPVNDAIKLKTSVISSRIDSITPDELVISEDGNYYIFKWFVDVSSLTPGTDFEDLLPDDATLYIEEDYGVTIWWGNNAADIYTSLTAYNTDFVYIESTDGSNNKLELNAYATAYSYYIKVPKEIVDKEIAETGKYVQTNEIKAKDESEYVPFDLIVSEADSSGTITKKNTNDDSSRVTNSKGLAIGDTRAYYTVEVNPEALYLSNNDYVTVKDVFKVMKYLDSSGEYQYGYDLVNAELENVSVYEVDNTTGKRTLLTSGYSYVVSQENSIVKSETDLTPAFSSLSNIVIQGDGLYLKCNGDWKYDKGTVLTFKVNGPDGQAVSLNEFDSLSIEKSSDTFVNGSVTLTLTVLDEISSEVNLGLTNATDVNVVKYVKVTETEVTQHIATFTIPDGKHIIIEYEYLLTNTDGTPIGQGLSLWLENDSIVYTSGGEESSTAKEEQYAVTEVTGSISTGGASKIVKVDVGNYSIKNLEAEFILAKYDAEKGDWYYATDFPFSTSVDSKGDIIVSDTDHNISFENALGEKTDLNGMIPTADQAKRILINGSFNVVFEEDALYKLIELKAPDGYIQTGFVEGESSVADMQDFTTYFAYMYETSTISDDVKIAAGISTETEVTMLNYLGSIEIPNIKPITIGAKKEWEQDPASAVNNPSVTIELWKSYLQTSSGIPDESTDMSSGAVKVDNASDYFTDEIKNAENMTTSYGIGNEDGSFTLIRQGESDYIWQADAIWENLPNGEKGKPVYYYIKEVAYTIGGTTYTLDTDSTSDTYGKYVDSAGNVYTDENDYAADYKPLYTNNALNETGVAKITNTRRFVIKKIWMRSDGTIMTNPPDDPIEIMLEGYNAATGEWQEIILGSSGILTPDVNWEVEIPQKFLTAYSKFRLSEVDQLYNYTVSKIYELDGTVGTISLINKSKSPTLGSLEVTKEWGDDTSHDPITVTLYQASSGIEEAALAEMSKGTMPENAEDINLKIVELDGVDSEVILNSGNGWTYKWEDLPYADEYEHRIFYYAVETAVPEGYTVTYEKANGVDQKITITNDIPGALAINKNWIDTDGNPVTVGNGSAITVDIYTATVTSVTTASTIVETTTVSTTTQEGDTETETNTLKIMAIGDSITERFNSWGAWRKFFYDDFVNNLGYNVDMVGKWSDGTSDNGTLIWDDAFEAIQGYLIKSDADNTNLKGILEIIDSVAGNADSQMEDVGAISTREPDIVLVMIGTNDVLQSYAIPTIQARYQALVDEIYSQKSDVKLFLISPPRIDSSEATWSPPNNQTLMDSNMDSLVKAINAICESETANGNYCKYIDVYKGVFGGENYADLLADYTHPDESGYEAIGLYVSKQLNSYLTTGEPAPDESEEEVEIEIVEADDSETLTSLINQGIISKKESITIEPDENGNWSTVLTDLPAHVEGDPNTLYVYYVVEQDGSIYNVSYKGNGQLLSETGTVGIELTNTKEFEPIDITVNKVWPEELPEGVTIPTGVTVGLYSSITQTDDEANWTLEQTATLENTDWTYTFTNLHGGKFWYVKEIADGWTATYDGNGVTAEDGTITITNAIETGSISVNKEWYKENTGNNSSVKVKVYRVAYNDDGTPIYEYQPRLSSTSAAFSLSSMRSALAAASSKETESEVPFTSDVTLNLDTVEVLSSAATLYVEINGLSSNTDYYLNDSTLDYYCGDKTIEKIVVTYEYYSGGPVFINGTQITPTVENNVATFDSTYFTNPLTTFKYWDWGCKVSNVKFYYAPNETLELAYGSNKTNGSSSPTISVTNIVAGDTVKLTAIDPIGDVVWKVNGNTVTDGVNGNEFTYLVTEDVTISATDNTATRTANVTVTPFQINEGAKSVILVEGGEKVTLEANNANGTVTWSSNNAAVSVDENTGELTWNYYVDTSVEENKVTITADHGNGVTDTITVNVQPAAIQLTIDKTTLHNGGTATLTPSKEDVEYSVDKEGIVSIEGNTVTAVGEGTVTITATRNGKTASVTLTVAELAVSPVSGTYNINSTVTLTLENVVGGISSVVSSNPGAVKWIATSGNTVTLEAVDEGDAIITITDGESGEAVSTITVTIQQAEVNEPDIENIGWLWNKELTPGTDNNWYAELTNLPLTDGNGHTFTYYVVEELPDGVNYYPIYYSETDGFTLENGENTSVEITNKAEEVESTPTVLPEAGGSGLKVYYVAGGMIMLLAAAGYIMVKRRKYDTKTDKLISL